MSAIYEILEKVMNNEPLDCGDMFTIQGMLEREHERQEKKNAERVAFYKELLEVVQELGNYATATAIQFTLAERKRQMISFNKVTTNLTQIIERGLIDRNQVSRKSVYFSIVPETASVMNDDKFSYSVYSVYGYDDNYNDYAKHFLTEEEALAYNPGDHCSWMTHQVCADNHFSREMIYRWNNRTSQWDKER